MPTSTRARRTSVFYDTSRQICRCPNGRTEASAPTGRFTFSPKMRAILQLRPAREGQSPSPTAFWNTQRIFTQILPSFPQNSFLGRIYFFTVSCIIILNVSKENRSYGERQQFMTAERAAKKPRFLRAIYIVCIRVMPTKTGGKRKKST